MYHLFFLTLNWPVWVFVLALIAALAVAPWRTSQPADRKVYDRAGRYPSLARLAVAGVLYFGCFWHMWTWVSDVFDVMFGLGILLAVVYRLAWSFGYQFKWPKILAFWMSWVAWVISLTLLVVTTCGALGVSHWRGTALLLLIVIVLVLVALALRFYGEVVMAAGFGAVMIVCLVAFVFAGAHLHRHHNPQAGGSQSSTSAAPTSGSSTASAAPTTSAAPSTTPASPSATPTSSASSTAANQGGGGGSATSPVLVALENPGPGNCAPGPAILAELRKQKPGGEDFRAPYDSYELQTLASTEEGWVATHVNEPCVRAIAARYNVLPKALPAYMQTHFSLREVGHGGLTVQNSYFDHQNGSIVWWQVQHFPQGELVWFSPSGVPLQKYVCLNALKRVTPPSGKTSTPTSPSSTPTTPSAPSTHPSTTHKPKPSKTPTPTHSTSTPKPQKPVLSITPLNDVEISQHSAGYCVSVVLQGNDRGTVSLSAKYGRMSVSSYGMQGSSKKCDITYYAPTEVPRGGTDTITVTVKDNKSGLMTTRSTSFKIKAPISNRP